MLEIGYDWTYRNSNSATRGRFYVLYPKNKSLSSSKSLFTFWRGASIALFVEGIRESHNTALSYTGWLFAAPRQHVWALVMCRDELQRMDNRGPVTLT